MNFTYSFANFLRMNFESFGGKPIGESRPGGGKSEKIGRPPAPHAQKCFFLAWLLRTLKKRLLVPSALHVPGFSGPQNSNLGTSIL